LWRLEIDFQGSELSANFGLRCFGSAVYVAVPGEGSQPPALRKYRDSDTLPEELWKEDLPFLCADIDVSENGGAIYLCGRHLSGAQSVAKFATSGSLVWSNSGPGRSASV